MRLSILLLLSACGGLSSPAADRDVAKPAPASRAVDAEAPRKMDARPAELSEISGAEMKNLKALGYLGDEPHGGKRAPRHQPALRAGSTDDNADFAAFTRFLGQWTDRRGMSGRYQRLAVQDRTVVSVEDGDHRAVPGARVMLMAGNDVVHTAETGGDGLTHVFPHLSGDGGPYAVVVTHIDGATQRLALTPGQSLDVVLDVQPLAPTVPLDVAIVLDTTGSMGDELDRIKATLEQVVGRIEQLDANVDVRVGAVLYRDKGEEYLTRVVPMGAGTDSVRGPLRAATAGGGGDGPEALNEGLAAAVEELEWRDTAAKVSFLIADAPPHMDYNFATPYGDAALGALDKGIRVHTVAASGLDDVGSLVFRQIAQVTRGQFVFIEYGDVRAAAADHGVASKDQISSNNLDAILFERIRAEVDAWGR